MPCPSEMPPVRTRTPKTGDDHVATAENLAYLTLTLRRQYFNSEIMFNKPTSLFAMSSLPGRFASSAHSAPTPCFGPSRHDGDRRVPVVVLATLLVVVLVFASGCGSGSGADADLSRWQSEAAPHNGEWTLLTSESSAIDPWRRLRVALDADQSTLTLMRTWPGA